jgi:hypothetical protein
MCHDFKQVSPFLVITIQHASIFCLSPGLRLQCGTTAAPNFQPTSGLDAVYGTWTELVPPRLAYSVLLDVLEKTEIL